MAELKTKATGKSVTEFLQNLTDPVQRADSLTLLDLFQQGVGVQGKLWGDAIVGFGDYHYKYASGREGDWFVLGFSPRKQNLTLYFQNGIGQYTEVLARLGKHKVGGGCLYIKRLSDINLDVLKELIAAQASRFESPPG